MTYVEGGIFDSINIERRRRPTRAGALTLLPEPAYIEKNALSPI